MPANGSRQQIEVAHLEARTRDIGTERFTAAGELNSHERTIDRVAHAARHGGCLPESTAFSMVDVLATFKSTADVNMHSHEYIGDSASQGALQLSQGVQAALRD